MLCYVNLCIDHGVLDADMKIVCMTMYPHGCEGVHIICTLRMGKRYVRRDVSNDSPCIWAFQKKLLVLFVLLKLLCGSKSNWILFDQGLSC